MLPPRLWTPSRRCCGEWPAPDGITTPVQFTRPLTGATFWCPGVRGGRLDLGAIDL
jgi:hypothetical protein